MARPILQTLREVHRTISAQFIILDELYKTRQSRVLSWVPQDLARLSSVTDSLSFHISDLSDPGSTSYVDVLREPKDE